MDQTDIEASKHKDSVSRAPDLRIVFSSNRDRRTSVSVGRPGSNEGEAMGESSQTILKRPSVGLVASGFTTSADTRTRIL